MIKMNHSSDIKFKKEPTASTELVKMLLQCASSMGADQTLAKSISKVEIDRLDYSKDRIPIKEIFNIWHELEKISADMNFGLHMGEMANQRAVGNILLTMMMNCDTVSSALDKLIRYHALVTDLILLNKIEQRHFTCLRWEMNADSIEIDRHYTEMVFCGIVFPLRYLTQDVIRPYEIHFRHRQPDDISEHQRIFDCKLVFFSSENELLFKREDLNKPVLMANNQLLRTLELFAQEMLESLNKDKFWIDRTVYLINYYLVRGERPLLESIARELNLSQRQLQINLKHESEITFQELLDKVRKNIAMKYLGETQMDICEIAFLLGFSEQSAFNHAFKRWTGKTPGELRVDENSR